MRLLPYFQETLVLPWPEQETASKLKQATRPLEKGVEYPDAVEKSFLFNGWVKENRFRISRKIKHPENFLPLIIGSIEGTSAGSIVFVQYRLFFSSAIFLIFWSVTAVFLCFFFLIFYKNYIHSAVSALLGVLNYIVATKNFHLQIKSSRKALNEVLTIDDQG